MPTVGRMGTGKSPFQKIVKPAEEPLAFSLELLPLNPVGEFIIPQTKTHNETTEDQK